MEENEGRKEVSGLPAEQSTTSTSKLHLLHKSCEPEDKKDECQDMKQSLQENQSNFNEVVRLLLPGFAPAATNHPTQNTIQQLQVQGQINKFLSSVKQEDKIKQQQQQILNIPQGQHSFQEKQNLQQIYQTILSIQQQMIEDEERMLQLITKRGEIFSAQLGFLEREIKQSISKFEITIKEKKLFAEQFHEKQVKFFELAQEALSKDVMETLVDMTVQQSTAMIYKILQKQKEYAKQLDFKKEFTHLIQTQIMVPFKQTCKQFESKIMQVMAQGWKQYLQELDAIKRKVLFSRTESINNLSTIEEDLGGQLEDFLLHIDEKIQQSIFKGSTIEVIGKQDPQVVIQALLEADQVDDAFRQCLTCKDNKILNWMLSKLSPEQTLSTLQLTQPVLIGLVQQISMFLEGSSSDERSTFLKWLQECLLLLDENDPELGEYMKKYLEDAYTTLQQFHKDTLTMEQHRDILLSTHLMNSKLRFFEIQKNN